MKKRFRKNVAAIVLSQEYPLNCKILVALRLDIDVWQFPQGGIDDGESPKEALIRELEEELGTKEFEIIAEYPEWLSYEFPNEAVKKKYNFDGQTQRYFLVKVRDNNLINLNTNEPEFKEHLFVDYKDINPYINHFKRPLYTKVLKYFQKEGFIGC
ncbi:MULTISPECIES: RNA pyrophosphohydrolase [unclassified Campylobacter]|uniref:RNA pyrophosphohydrolase n=1 Tax=unclassified Campylobacter TaxID=2593542 RepID=UPI001BDB5355|nr:MULTISPECIES: RNA pyrophosphohydrolase [unclassified Campylobacter]MBZ7976416.1 RNA pyrophosphohydrolase [Campylobacter sp. RM12637]MBZ7978838.1 RNA pyrophosphohydrolase [Campylobacter sp. RM12654]MBZ7980659.1 RNA pyrophosphohydrolase [Campylobacter sp. RM12642]MBZ7982571.1 RNA pyrophosphohydrolase [Campylobacter sp. RM12640]MBZ7984245.1 RNA pyrophosphohydrolase [Campylobacter sp. RM12647]MBZ7989343.1 RNA pyrophosphohydrolase [Campylobacter sp. RM12635]MBZ7991236.1 RNA pyrophosphohydrolas